MFDILNGKVDGTSSLTRKTGIKLATTVSMKHNNMEPNHECTVSLTKRRMEASVAKTEKINLPLLNLELNQSVGKGNFHINWALEALSSHLSLEISSLR